MNGRNDTAYKKYMIWRGYGMNTSRNSQLGHTIKYNNEKPTFKSKHELDLIIHRKKTVCIIYFFPVRDILQIMARDGKIDGKFINRKVGWKWNDISKEELMVDNNLEWKVRFKTLEEFKADMDKIRNYRVYYTNIQKATNDTYKVIEQMLKNEEWTMNERDGYMKIKDLWNEYRVNCTKVKNLEFRICNKENETICELPIVFQEDNDMFETRSSNPIELQKMDDKWAHLENDIAVSKRKKRKRKHREMRLVEPKRIRIGNEEMLDKMNEIKKIMLYMKESKVAEDNERILDKADQLYDINRTVYDEEVKDVFRQIVISRRDNNDLPYKILEEELLTGQNYTLKMPKMDNIRNNLLGMLQEINEIKTSNWEDTTLADRLQIITANRFKTVVETNLKNIFNELVNYKKELEIVNDTKNECDSKQGLDIIKLLELLSNINGEANYENKRLHYIERWTEEIEKNVTRGMKKKKNIERKEDEREVNFRLPIEQNPMNKVNISKMFWKITCQKSTKLK